LFKKFPFFRAYEHFIQISIYSKSEEHHKKWQGFAESKIKKFLNQLEILGTQLLKTNFIEYRPWTKSYSLPTEEFAKNETYFIGFRVRNCDRNQDEVSFNDTRREFYKHFRDLVMFDEKFERVR